MQNWEKIRQKIYHKIESHDYLKECLGTQKDKIQAAKIALSGKGKSDKFVDFLVVRRACRDLFKTNHMFAILWTTDIRSYKWIIEPHFVCADFLQRGMVAIPDKYRYTPNAKFIDRRDLVQTTDTLGKPIILDATPQLIMMSRSLGKSVDFHIIGLIQEVAKDPYTKWLMTHGSEEKVKNNLNQLKSFIMMPSLNWLFPEIFRTSRDEYIDAGGRLTNFKIDINIGNLEDIVKKEDQFMDVRREATFTIGTIGIDPTGLHFDGQYDDDLVTEKTSKTEKETEKTTNYYRLCFALAERQDRVYPRRLTGTAQWGPNTYDEIESEVTLFKLPGELTTQDGKKFYVSEHWNDNTIERMKRDYKEFYPAFINMENRPRDAELKLVNDNSFLFAYADEINVPSKVQKIPYTLKQLLNSGCVVTSKDPSYSSSHTKSLDATATGTISDGVLYMMYASQVAGASEGEEISEIIFQPIIDQVRKFQSDWYIQDAQGNAQKFVFQAFKRRLKEEFPNMKFAPYTGQKASGTKSKFERAQMFLADLFLMNKIRVHWRQQRLIDEILRISQTFDFLDVLNQIVAIISDFDMAGSTYKARKQVGFSAQELFRKKPKTKKYSVVNY